MSADRSTPNNDPSPDWLTQAVSQSCRSSQWTALLSTVNDRIQTHIGSFGLPMFSDMDEATQTSLVEKEFKELVKMKSPSLYHYSGSLNAAVDQALLQRLRGQTHALQYNVDHLTNICTSAVKDILLGSPPQMAKASQIFINRPLPRSLRPFIWSNSFGFNSINAGIYKNYASRLSPMLEVLLSRRCQKLLDHFFVKISTRANAALVKTVVANFMKTHNLPLPVDEDQCAVGTSFDHLVFLVVPVMAVLKMFSPSGGYGAAFLPTQVGVDESGDGTPAGGIDHENDNDIKTAVLTAVSAMRSLTSQQHLNIREKSGAITPVSFLLNPLKELLQKKHFDFEFHLTHLSSAYKRDVSTTLHHQSVYLSTYLPVARKKDQLIHENGFFGYINFCLLRAFSGCASPEVTIFVMDQCLILGFSLILPLVACALLLGSSEELLALDNCDSAIDSFDNYCRLITVGKMRRLLSAFCTEELTHIYDDEGAYRLLTNEDNILETMYNKLLPQFSPPPPPSSGVDSSTVTEPTGDHIVHIPPASPRSSLNGRRMADAATISGAANLSVINDTTDKITEMQQLGDEIPNHSQSSADSEKESAIIDSNSRTDENGFGKEDDKPAATENENEFGKEDDKPAATENQNKFGKEDDKPAATENENEFGKEDDKPAATENKIASYDVQDDGKIENVNAALGGIDTNNADAVFHDMASA